MGGRLGYSLSVWNTHTIKSTMPTEKRRVQESFTFDLWISRRLRLVGNWSGCFHRVAIAE